jgi:hypothetical protein
MIEPVLMRDTGQGTNFMVVLIGLVIIFKSQLTSLVQNIFSKIVSESAGI